MGEGASIPWAWEKSSANRPTTEQSKHAKQASQLFSFNVLIAKVAP
jgi:hypothetical protein